MSTAVKMGKGKKGAPKERIKQEWFRSGRGWYATDGHTNVPLRDETGRHIKDPGARAEARRAYVEWEKTRATVQAPKVGDVRPGTATMQDVVAMYHADCQRRVEGVGKPLERNSLKFYMDTLFNFCTGYPASLRKKPRRRWTDEEKAKKIHAGFGHMPVSEFKGLHAEQWLNANPGWRKARKRYLKHLRAAVNYGVRLGIIENNPLEKYTVAAPDKKNVYISPEHEQLMYRHASPALRIALKLCIRMGMRPICEMATVTAKHLEHVEHQGVKTIQFVLPPHMSKNRKVRRIAVLPYDHPDHDEVRQIITERLGRVKSGPLFLSPRGVPWSKQTMRQQFARLLDRIERKEGVRIRYVNEKTGEEVSPVFYDTRHTYAKRMYSGYWSRSVSLDTLASMMGNSPKTCYDYYAKDFENLTGGLPLGSL